MVKGRLSATPLASLYVAVELAFQARNVEVRELGPLAEAWAGVKAICLRTASQSRQDWSRGSGKVVARSVREGLSSGRTTRLWILGESVEGRRVKGPAEAHERPRNKGLGGVPARNAAAGVFAGSLGP